MTQPLERVGDAGAERRAEHDGQVRQARVNLLPAEILVERRQRRVALASMVLLLAYLVGLGGWYVVVLGDVDEARAQRDDVQLRVAALQAELDTLAEYDTLLATVTNRESLLTAAMDAEVSWARVLGDIALAFDNQSSLTALSASTLVAQDPALGTIAGGGTDASDPDDPIGQVSFTGYSVDRFAPGVQEVLTRFDDVDGFIDSYLSLATDEERGTTDVTTFEGSLELTDDAYTHRYDDGLPEESLSP